jgi:hypothetical protein
MLTSRNPYDSLASEDGKQSFGGCCDEGCKGVVCLKGSLRPLGGESTSCRIATVTEFEVFLAP